MRIESPADHMRLGLLGVDDQTLALAAAARQRDDPIVLAAEPGPREAEARAVAPHVQLATDWSELLDFDAVDAVFVAADEPLARVDQLRRLIQLGMPVLVSHPVSLSMLECYELDMIRRESRSVVVPYLPARWHPAARSMQDFLSNARGLGAVEQVLLERFLDARQREPVLRQFARDADLLQFVAGEATRLHALGSAAGPAGAGPYGNLAVQMTSAAGVVARWSVTPVEEVRGGRLTLVGSLGKALLWMPEDDLPWQLEIRGGQETSTRVYHGWNPAETGLERLAAAIGGELIEPTWSEAARTVELAETIDLSLARGRTIDLHREDFTDIGTFKGTMASVGCGLLMGGLAVVVLVAMAGSIAAQAGWHDLAAILAKWPYLLLAVLALYLMLQLFLLIGKPSESGAVTAHGATVQRPAGESSKPSG